MILSKPLLKDSECPLIKPPRLGVMALCLKHRGDVAKTNRGNVVFLPEYLLSDCKSSFKERLCLDVISLVLKHNCKVV